MPIDRTGEFLSCVAAARPDVVVKPLKPLRRQSPSEFTRRAALISGQLGSSSQMLAQLTKLVQRRGLFDDPTSEINQLATLIKRDINQMKQSLDDLAAESSQAPPLGADSAAASGKAHSEQVVTRLKSQLLDTTKEFQGMLQVRTQSMKVQQDRRGHFGQPRTLHLTPPSHPVAPAPASPAVAFGGQPFSAAPAAAAGSHASAAEGGPATAYASPGASTADSLHMRRASPAAASQQSHVQLPQPVQHQLQQQQQQQQLIPAGGAYLEQRANAVSDIESHISELGTIFSRLSALVAEQGQMVERIDDDVEAAHEHVQSGQQQLQRYWSGLSSNRALTAKMFGVLISTILIFLFFLA